MKTMEPPVTGKQQRLYFNDWLNVTATLIIFTFHCASFFKFEDRHVKNNQLSPGLSLYASIICQWIMLLLLFIPEVPSIEIDLLSITYCHC